MLLLQSSTSVYYPPNVAAIYLTLQPFLAENLSSDLCMAAKYREYQQLNLPSIEEETLKTWSEKKTFEESINLRNGARSFVFYEGPPSTSSREPSKI
jgi:hypothetical protein